MIDTDQTVNVIQNNSIFLNCSMKANPKPTFEWFKDEYVHDIKRISMVHIQQYFYSELIAASKLPEQMMILSKFKGIP